MPPTFVQGYKAALKLHNGTTLEDISEMVTSANLDRSRDTAETTHFGSTGKEYLPTLKDATLSFEGMRDTVLITHVLDAYDQDEPVAWEFYPEGVTAGLPLESGDCIVTGVSESSSVGETNSVSCEVQIVGPVVRGVAA